MNIYVVAPQHVAALWPKIETFLAEALAVGWSDFYALWDVKRALIDGVWLLWVAADGDENIVAALVARTADYPKCRVCEVLLCGGRDMASWVKPIMGAVEGYARVKGAAFLQSHGRPGWSRLCGGREQSRVFVKELR